MAISTDNPPSARLLDITRLISRVGRGPPTGVDRVELAYLSRLSSDSVPLFLLARSSLGFVLMGGAAAQPLMDRITGITPWGAADLLSRLARFSEPDRAAAEADLRRLSLDRCRPAGLGGMLRKHLPRGTAYLNVGHSNLEAGTLAAIRDVPDMRITVLVHDTIPLDHPEFSARGVPPKFAAKLAAIGDHADLVICNSHATAADVQRHLAPRGHVPRLIRAHLGVDPPCPDFDALAQQPAPGRPWFVTVGTIEPRKNHALLLRVWQELSDEMAAPPLLFIVGRRGWRNEDVFRMLDTAPFMERSVFEMNTLSDGALAALVSGARALLFPSLAEGYGLPPLEAAALGVPVLATDLAVYREVLGDFGVYLDGRDPYSWRKKIIELTRDAGAKGSAESAGLAVPAWADHFDIVLGHT